MKHAFFFMWRWMGHVVQAGSAIKAGKDDLHTKVTASAGASVAAHSRDYGSLLMFHVKHAADMPISVFEPNIRENPRADPALNDRYWG
ncbi:MAG: hypothetical protein N3A02_03595, partial [Rectinema sp.]|nr:hypothetical protein [Rectinema sp.]